MIEKFAPHSYPGEGPQNEKLTRNQVLDTERTALSSEQQMVRFYLDSIDEERLLSIMRTYLAKSGRDSDAHNFIPLSNIVVLDNKGANAGSYESTNGVIELDAEALANDPTKLLWVLIHEELHAVSDNGRRECPEVEDKEKTYKQERVGVNIVSWKQYSPDSNDATGSMELFADQYRPVNEGITEYLTDKILSEYLNQTGDTAMYGRQNIERERGQALMMYEYAPYVRVVRTYITLIAAITGLTYETVENGVFRAYFRGSDILPEEIVEELEKREPGLSEKIHDLLSIEEPAETEIGIARLIGNLSTFSPEEKITVLNGALQILTEGESFYNKNVNDIA